MRTNKPKTLLLCALFLGFFNVAVGQITQPQPNTDNIPELQTIKDYNDYVRSIDWYQLTKEEKINLENTYNLLVEQMDQKFHKPAPVKDLSYNNNFALYTCADLKASLDGSLRRTHLQYKLH